MTIGMFIAPFALLLCALAGFRANAWPPFLLAILVGPGLVALLIGFLHLDYVPCPPGPLTAGPGEHFKCGGFDPTPWLTTGAGLVALGLSAYALYRRHAGNSIRDAHSPGAV
jgi:hypothetical protein